MDKIYRFPSWGRFRLKVREDATGHTVWKTQGVESFPAEPERQQFWFDGARVTMFPGNSTVEAQVRLETYAHFGQLTTVSGPKAVLTFIMPGQDLVYQTSPIKRSHFTQSLRLEVEKYIGVPQDVYENHSGILLGHSAWTANAVQAGQEQSSPGDLPSNYP